MGKAANERAYREFECLDRQKQEESFEDESPLTEAEFEAGYSDWHWNRIDAEVDKFSAEAGLGRGR